MQFTGACFYRTSACLLVRKRPLAKSVIVLIVDCVQLCKYCIYLYLHFERYIFRNEMLDVYLDILS